jgi:hypothetical protein
VTITSGAVFLAGLSSGCSERGMLRQETSTSRLTGRVLDGDHGVAGACVSVGSPIAGEPTQLDTNLDLEGVTIRVPPSSENLYWTLADGSGHFDIQVAASGDLLLLASMPGGGFAQRVPVHLQPDQTCTADVVATGPHIHGRVIERGSGRGLADASLQLTWLPGRRPAHSDGEGRFVLACVPPENREILVEHPGHVSQLFGPVSVSAGSLDDVQFELDRESVIEGTLLDAAGAPLLEPQGILVFRDDHKPQPSGTEMLYAETNDGHFRIGGVASGRQRVGVIAPIRGDVAWRLKYWLDAIHDDQPVDVAVGQTVNVTLQESIPVSPAPPANH